MIHSPEVLVENRIHSDTVAFYVVEQTGQFQVAYAQPVVMEKVENPEVQPMVPTFSLRRTQAQALMDRLWQAGLRPSEGSGSAGALAATQKHLEDFRTILFHKLEVDAPTR